MNPTVTTSLRLSQAGPNKPIRFLMLAAALFCSHISSAYEPDGHYWTVLIVTTMLGIPDAKEIAYSAEYPDNVINRDGYAIRSRPTFMYPKAQKKAHALTGGLPDYERTLSLQMLREATTPAEKGIAAHRLGDSFAHTNDKKGRMYPHIIGHMFKWKKPDKIKTNPSKYMEYVRTLIKGFGGNPDEFDLTVFQYIADGGFDSEVNEAILKTEYSVQCNAMAFCVGDKQLIPVKEYLEFRAFRNQVSYVVHNNVDEKGRTTNTIILTGPLRSLSAHRTDSILTN